MAGSRGSRLHGGVVGCASVHRQSAGGVVNVVSGEISRDLLGTTTRDRPFYFVEWAFFTSEGQYARS